MKRVKVFISIFMCLFLLMGQVPAMALTPDQGIGNEAIPSFSESVSDEEGAITDGEGTVLDEEKPVEDEEGLAGGAEEPVGDEEEPVVSEEEPEVFGLLSAEGYWSAYVSGASAGTDYTVDASGNYAIHTAAGLAYFASLVNGGNDFYGKTVTLTANIDISAHYWVPIGQYRPPLEDGPAGETRVQNAFWGTFDGGGHYIDNMTIGGNAYSRGDGAYNEANGLFGLNMGTVKNVGVRDIRVDTYRRGAGIAGINFGTVALCMSTGSGVLSNPDGDNPRGITANGAGGTRGTGGIVGSNHGLVYGCYSSVDVYNAANRAGGIVGYNTKATYNPQKYGPAGSSESEDVAVTGVIDHCFFTGKADSYRGGSSGSIACTNYNDGVGGIIRNCYYLKDSAADPQDNGCPVGYSGDAQAYEFDETGKLTGDTSKTLLTEISAACNFVAGTGAYPVLFWERGDYSWEAKYTVTIPETITGGSITVKTQSGATVAAGDKFEIGTVLKLTADPATDYLFNYFTANGAQVGGSADGATFVVTQDVTLGAKFKNNVPATLNLGEFSDFVVHAYDMQGKELSNGAKIYVGDSFKILATLKNGAFPVDQNKRYTGTFSYPAANKVLVDDKNVAKVTRGADGSVTKGYTYTLDSVAAGDVLNFSGVTAISADKTWLDNDYGVTWYDTSWYTGNKTEYTLTTAAQLAGFSYLSGNVTTFDGITIKLGADIDIMNPDGTGSTRMWTAIGNPRSYIKLTGVTPENFADCLKQVSTSVEQKLYYYNANGTMTNTVEYVTGVSEYYQAAYFAGNFDGQNHTVSILNTASTYAALFGYLKGAEVKDLTVAGNISGSGNVAAIAAGADASAISNCVNTASITTTGKQGGVSPRISMIPSLPVAKITAA